MIYHLIYRNICVASTAHNRGCLSRTAGAVYVDLSRPRQLVVFREGVLTFNWSFGQYNVVFGGGGGFFKWVFFSFFVGFLGGGGGGGGYFSMGHYFHLL